MTAVEIWELIHTSYRTMDSRQSCLWAIYCAEKVLPLFEGEHPKQFGPRNAIACAKEWIDKPDYKRMRASDYGEKIGSALGYAADSACWAAECVISAWLQPENIFLAQNCACNSAHSAIAYSPELAIDIIAKGIRILGGEQ